MAASAPFLRGPLATHPLAENFAGEVHRVHRRYAVEVVAKHRLCPHLRDVDRDFGDFIVILDARAEPDVDLTAEAVRASENAIKHVIFPLVCPPPSLFERFAGRVNQAIRRALLTSPPVMATFHPALVGDAEDPHRLVGLLRRAPDPFVQFIPDGYQEGGTTFAPLPAPGEPLLMEERMDWPTRNFEKLRGDNLERLLAIVADIKADRDRSYAPYLAAFGLSS